MSNGCVGFSCQSACVSLQSPFFVSPPATLAVHGKLFTVVCLISACVSFSYFSSRFSWLHSQAVQRCGCGFGRAASSTHVLVSGTGVSPNLPYLYGSSGWAGVMVRPLKAGS